MCLALWRLLDQVAVVDLSGRLIYTRNGLLDSNAPGLFSAIGINSIPFAPYSIGSFGIAPYVTALVIVSVIAAMSARVRGMALARWTAGLALAFAFVGAQSWTGLMQSAGIFAPTLDPASRAVVSLELTAGTAVMILLAHTLDEHGYGFGYGAVLLYAVGAFIDQIYRVAGYMPVLSVEHVYSPVFVWAGVWIVMAALTVGMLLAFRRLSLPVSRSRRGAAATVEMRFLTPGVLRPPQFTFAVLALPGILARYYPPTSGIAFLADNLSPYSLQLWAAALFVALELSLIVFFAWFVAACDWRLMPGVASLRPHAMRLALLSGAGLALIIVLTPIADHILTLRVGQLIPLSAADGVLITAVVLLFYHGIEGRRAVPPYETSAAGLP